MCLQVGAIQQLILMALSDNEVVVEQACKTIGELAWSCCLQLPLVELSTPLRTCASPLLVSPCSCLQCSMVISGDFWSELTPACVVNRSAGAQQQPDQPGDHC